MISVRRVKPPNFGLVIFSGFFVERRFAPTHCVAKARRSGSMFWFFSMIFFPAGWLGKFNIGPMQGRGVLKFRPEQPLTKEMGLPKFQLPST